MGDVGKRTGVNTCLWGGGNTCLWGGGGRVNITYGGDINVCPAQAARACSQARIRFGLQNFLPNTDYVVCRKLREMAEIPCKESDCYRLPARQNGILVGMLAAAEF